MAAKYWPGEQALGRRFRQGNPTRPWITVVGIMANVTHNSVTAEIKPKFYRAFAQWHRSSGNPANSMTLVIKARQDPSALAGPIRDIIRRLDSGLPVAAVRTMDEVVGRSIATPRLTGALLAMFAALGLCLAALGIYGVLSYVVSLRRQEIGIRLAIGARPGHVLAAVVRQGVAYAALGALVGIAGAAAASQLLEGLLHEVTPLDPATFIATPAILLVVATAASLIPAWRATKVDPVRAIQG
jgi:cell division protein FtsX